MQVKFWGTRGSLPAPLGAAAVRAKIADALVKAAGRMLDTPEKAEAFIDAELSFAEHGTFGGNSACVEIRSGSDSLLLDLGSGAREFSSHAVQSGRTPRTYDILMSHPHWDHIMGFPFFVPAFGPRNRIRIHGCHPNLEASFRRQNAAPNFPVEFDALSATIEFVTLEPGTKYEIGGFAVTPHKQGHPGDSYGYRIERDGKSVVYSTDSEYDSEDMQQADAFVSFIARADLVIFDAMYTHADLIAERKDWGHSSNVLGIEFCTRAEARHLCLFHHDPDADDARLQAILGESRQLKAGTELQVSSAYDGLVIEV